MGNGAIMKLMNTTKGLIWLCQKAKGLDWINRKFIDYIKHLRIIQKPYWTN